MAIEREEGEKDRERAVWVKGNVQLWLKDVWGWEPVPTTPHEVHSESKAKGLSVNQHLSIRVMLP